MSWKFDTAARKSVSRSDAAMLRNKARGVRHAENAKVRDLARSGSISDALDAWGDYSADPNPFNVGKFLKNI